MRRYPKRKNCKTMPWSVTLRNFLSNLPCSVYQGLMSSRNASLKRLRGKVGYKNKSYKFNPGLVLIGFWTTGTCISVNSNRGQCLNLHEMPPSSKHRHSMYTKFYRCCNLLKHSKVQNINRILFYGLLQI